MAKQGFQLIANNPFVYQECDAGPSAALGLDNTNSLWRLKVLAAAGATPTAVSHITIDPAANGNITLAPNGVGRVVLSGVYSAVPAAATTSVMTIDAAGQLGSTALATNGQVLIGSTGAAPVWAGLTAGANITITPGAGSISIAATATDMTWSREVGTPVALVAAHGYVQANAGAGLTTFNLPASAALGTEIEILGESSGGWTIAQGAGQSIQYGNIATTIGAGGSLSSSNRYDTVTLKCRVADVTWSVVGSVGVLSVV